MLPSCIYSIINDYADTIMCSVIPTIRKTRNSNSGTYPNIKKEHKYIRYLQLEHCSTLPELSDNILSLKIMHSVLVKMPDTYPSTLTRMSMFLVNTDKTLVLPPTLTFYDHYNNYYDAVGFPELFPDSIRILNLNYINITSIPALPKCLNRLVITRIPITVLPDLPAGLESIRLSGTLVECLPTLPLSLKDLHCSNNAFKVLPDLPASLEVLRCGRSGIQKLPPLPVGIRFVRISDGAYGTYEIPYERVLIELMRIGTFID